MDLSVSHTVTGLYGELEHLKIETRLIDKSFECVMGECVYNVTTVTGRWNLGTS